MENKKSQNFYLFLFFIGYYVAIDLGEKRNPRDSASYFVMINSLGLGIAIIFIMKFFGSDYSNSFAILGVGAIIAIVNHIVFTREFVDRKLPDYSYLGREDYKIRRRIAAISIFVVFLILTVGSAIINNEDVKRYLVD